MKALIALVLVTGFSAVAHADYFYCELTNGFNKVEMEAEYRVLSAAVTQRPFSCLGQVIPGSRKIVATIVSTETDENASAVDVASATVRLTALDIHGDGQDTGYCTCGMR